VLAVSRAYIDGKSVGNITKLLPRSELKERTPEVTGSQRCFLPISSARRREEADEDEGDEPVAQR
jgi:hypothetical protein